MTDYSALIARLEKGSGEDREIDGKLALLEISRLSDDERQRRALSAVEALERGATYPTGVPHYTGSLDAALAFAAAVLPGWAWRVASCSVSDDAWIVPDFNHPEHGAAFMARYPDEAKRDPVGWFGTDVDLRPPGRPARALLIAALKALQAKDTP